MSRVGVIGLGYVGLTTAVGMARLGHQVVGYDINESRVDSLRQGQSPIHEDGLEDWIGKRIADKSLGFTSDSAEFYLAESEFLFICVATPQDKDGAADLSLVFNVAKQAAAFALPDAVIVVKSTVPVGTGEKIQEVIGRSDVHVASNPEFLREGTALLNFMEPDRIVVGAQSDSVSHKVLQLYSKISSPKVATSIESAELTKYAANSYLAMRLTFANDIAELSARSGANVDDVLIAMGLDKRIGPSFLKPGPGWGGSCFPKDTKALVSVASEFGVNLPLVSATVKSNEAAFMRAAESIAEICGGSLKGKTIAVWGLSFKAGTDDTRDSPALAIIQILIDKGATVRVFDPIASAPTLAGLVQVPTAIDATQGADALAVLTEWPEFTREDPNLVAAAMKNAAVFDGRRILPEDWRTTFSSFRALGE
jgi:UDPglucose 6-dehydrogenase